MGSQDEWFATGDELASRVGWVVIRSATLDDLLREVLDELLETLLLIDVLSGQTTEWLCDACVKVLHNADPFRRRAPPEVHERFIAAIRGIGALREYRNDIVHGTWLTWSVNDDETRGRPFGGEISNATLFCIRERRGKNTTERAYDLEDISEVAARYDRQITEVALSFREVNAALFGQRQVLNRWPRGV